MPEYLCSGFVGNSVRSNSVEVEKSSDERRNFTWFHELAF